MVLSNINGGFGKWIVPENEVQDHNDHVDPYTLDITIHDEIFPDQVPRTDLCSMACSANCSRGGCSGGCHTNGCATGSCRASECGSNCRC